MIFTKAVKPVGVFVEGEHKEFTGMRLEHDERSTNLDEKLSKPLFQTLEDRSALHCDQ